MFTCLERVFDIGPVKTMIRFDECCVKQNNRTTYMSMNNPTKNKKNTRTRENYMSVNTTNIIKNIIQRRTILHLVDITTCETHRSNYTRCLYEVLFTGKGIDVLKRIEINNCSFGQLIITDQTATTDEPSIEINRLYRFEICNFLHNRTFWSST